MTTAATPAASARLSATGGLVRPVLALVASLLFFSEAPRYLYEVGAAPPASWAMFAMFGCAVLSTAVWPASSMSALRTPFAGWMAAYAVVSLAWAFTITDAPSLAIRIRSVLFLSAMLVILARPACVRWARLALALGVLVAAAANVYESFHPLTFSEVAGRSAGLYVNPNRAGYAIALGCALGLGVVPSSIRIPFVGIAILGLLPTFSRSGALMLACAVAWALWKSELNWKAAFVSLAVIFGSLYVLDPGIAVRVTRLIELNANTEARLSGDMSDGSVAERRHVFKRALELFEQRPILGHGTGASVTWDESVSSHNQMANWAMDHGVIGIAMWLWLLVALCWKNHSAIPFATVFAIGSMFSHNVLDEFFSLTALAVAGSMRWEQAAQRTPARATPRCVQRYMRRVAAPSNPEGPD